MWARLGGEGEYRCPSSCSELTSVAGVGADTTSDCPVAVLRTAEPSAPAEGEVPVRDVSHPAANPVAIRRGYREKGAIDQDTPDPSTGRLPELRRGVVEDGCENELRSERRSGVRVHVEPHWRLRPVRAGLLGTDDVLSPRPNDWLVELSAAERP